MKKRFILVTKIIFVIGLISFILITNKQIFNSQDINSQPIKVGGG